ncbi:aldo/keto reductase, partial [Singulisphaera rosea]
KPAEVLPKRRLGKTGVDITMLDQGAVRGPSYDRILRLAFAGGIRVFDTAKVYGTEPNLRKWFEQSPEVRKQIFLVTKDTPRSPGQMMEMVDKRLAALGTDYIDLFFIHGLGDEHTLDEAINLVKSREFKETAEAIRKSGKAKFIGFSTHHKDRGPIALTRVLADLRRAFIGRFLHHKGTHDTKNTQQGRSRRIGSLWPFPFVPLC